MNNKIKKSCDDGEELSLDSLANSIARRLKGGPTLALPDPDLLEFYEEMDNRVLWIRGEIDESILSIIRDIEKFNKEDRGIPVEERKPIWIKLSTIGGSVQVMWAVVQAIKMSKTPVYTLNYNQAMSAGAHILAAGHKRYGMPGSLVLIHSGSCAISGTQEQAKSAKEYFDGLTKAADEDLLASTKIEKKLYNKKAPFDWYINTEDALKFGIIDEIVSDFDIIG